MASPTPFSPSDWECPHCHRSHSPSSGLMLLRGTCLHDLCCIREIANQQRNVAASKGSLVEVPCPIKGCSGKFNALIDGNGGKAGDKVPEATHVTSTAKVKSEPRAGQEIIDLCDDETASDNSSVFRAAGKNKLRPTRGSISVKREEATPERASSINTEKDDKNVVSPLPAEDRSSLKPIFDIGDEVYAAWWDPKKDPKRKASASWHPGKIRSFNEVSHGQYGPIRLYSVNFDDGDRLDTIQDYWVFPKEEYLIKTKFDEIGREPIGVEEVYDKKSSDPWAKRVGWYDVLIGGEAHSFSSLSDAMKAHDDSVVRIHGARTKKTQLNSPEKYPLLFEESTTEGVNVKREIKCEPKEEEETDDGSRFSESEEEETDGKSPSKRMRRELPVKVGFWDAGPIEFSVQAFMTEPLFHLNSGIDGDIKGQNLFFGPFLREGVATPGFAPVPKEIARKVPHWSYSQIRDAINDTTYSGESIDSARQVAMWLKNATVGSFVLMRHEFKDCPLTPARLKQNGKYIGPVYVIGVITKKILPGSEEERSIQDHRMSEFDRHLNNIHSFCLVDWRRMGVKNDLTKQTKGYINAIIQPTLNRMCQYPRQVYKKGATGESVRNDLWENAKIPISSEDFPDVKDVNNIPHY